MTNQFRAVHTSLFDKPATGLSSGAIREAIAMSINNLRMNAGLALVRGYEVIERSGQRACRRALAAFVGKVIMPAPDIDKWISQQAQSASLDSPAMQAAAMRLLAETESNPHLAARIRPSTRQALMNAAALDEQA